VDNIDSKTLKEIDGVIGAIGLPVPLKMQENKIHWPDNIGDLTSDQLGEQLSWWSGWSAYTRWQLARAETNYVSADKRLTIETAKRLYIRRSDFKTVAETKNAVTQEEEIQRLEVEVMKKDALRGMLKALLEGYESKYYTISREITRRGNEFQQPSTRNHWNKKE
jgi:hypothetical protein